jgi:NADP-dependent 3-hydroxy acid dehydrogenase YdfG
MTTSRTSRKTILITEAGSDIGEAVARHLASDGHRVMLGGRRIERIAALARAIAQTGGAAKYQEIDVTSRGSVMAFLVIAEACFGRIDVLINTAGMMAGIVAALPVLAAQGVAQVIHVPTDHALQARAITAAIADAIGAPDHVDVADTTGRPGSQRTSRSVG